MDCISLLHPKGFKVDSFKEVSLSEKIQNLNDEDFYKKIDSLSKNKQFVINKTSSGSSLFKMVLRHRAAVAAKNSSIRIFGGLPPGAP